MRSDLAVVGAHGRSHLALGFPSDHITSSPDMSYVGAQGAIDGHGSRLVYLHPHTRETQLVRIRTAPGGDQELFC